MTSPENPVPFAVGDHVRKGNGRTIYRVIRVASDGRVEMCKASTPKDPARSCLYRPEQLSKVEAECSAARTGEGYWTCDVEGGCDDCRLLARSLDDDCFEVRA